MTSDYNDNPDQTRFPAEDMPSRQQAENPEVDPVDPALTDDGRGDFAGGPTAGGVDRPLPEPGAGPVGADGTDYPVGEPGGSVTGSETLDDPYGRPGVPGDRGEDPGVVIDPADQYPSGTGTHQPYHAAGSQPHRAVGNPGRSGQDDEYDRPRSIGNPGSTPDPADEYDQPRSIGNPGTTPDPADEYDQPRSIGNPGPNPDAAE